MTETIVISTKDIEYLSKLAYYEADIIKLYYGGKTGTVYI